MHQCNIDFSVFLPSAAFRFRTELLHLQALSVPFGSVMRLAEHLTVANIRRTAVAPGGHMICIHFRNLPQAVAIAIRTQGTEWAIGFSARFGSLGLAGIHRLFGRLVKDADI